MDVFIGPLKMDVVIKMHGGTHSEKIDGGNRRLKEEKEKENESVDLQACNLDYKPGEKEAITTFDKLKHAGR
jgi:hypothetical protein